MASIQANEKRPHLIVVMGVSGCGKSTIGRALAEHFGYRFLEGDEFHTDYARARMARGEPLNDELRAPWIKSICKRIEQLAQQQESCVLAYSGLKKAYRDPLRALGADTCFVFLDGDKETIRSRMEKRTGHYMPASLLDSQFATLEPPLDEPDVIRLDVTQRLENLVDEAARAISSRV